jgi:tetratricopeptide (TPR) repeat protein
MRILFAILAGLVIVSSIQAQDDRPKVIVPKEPATKQERDRKESLYQYTFGLDHLRDDRFAEALKAFEESARLDPKSAPPVKAQVEILVAMTRYTDALNACKKVVELDPGDYLMWYAQAKLLKALNRYPDAIAVLEKGVKCDALKEHPEAAQAFYVDLGELLENANKFGPAADAYKHAAAILEHPDQIIAKGPFPRDGIQARAAEIHEKIGQLYLKAKRYPDAVAALKQAQALAPDRAARLNFVIAQVCVQADDPKQALTFVDAYLRTSPLSTEPHELKISLLRSLGKADAIVPWLEETAERERFNTALRLLLAKECVLAKLPAKAESIYKKLADDSPNAAAYRGLFNVYKGEGATNKILTILDKVMDKAAREDGPAPIGTVQHARAMVGALRDDSDLGRAVVEAACRQKPAPDLKYDTIFFLAILADKNRQNEEAERFYRQCLDSKEHSDGQEIVLYGGLLRVLSNAHNYDAVIKVCQEGVEKSPKTNPLLFQKEWARALASLKKYDDALRQADVGIKKAGDDNRFIFQLLRVRILAMAKRYDDAETETKALLKKYDRPGEVIELRYVLSNIYSSAKQHAKSEEQLQMILKIDPDNATVNNDLGYLWADQNKNLAVAEEMIRKALEVERVARHKNPNLTPDEDKDNAAFVDSLGWVLFRRGQIDAARKELERATKLGDGDDPTIYDHLGDVYQRLKMRPEAVRVWQRAIELYDTGIRGKDDERVRDIRHKIDKAKEEVGAR